HKRDLRMTALNSSASVAVNHLLADEAEARDMDENGQHDQRQPPSPVRAPSKRVVCENVKRDLGDPHRTSFNRRNWLFISPLRQRSGVLRHHLSSREKKR